MRAQSELEIRRHLAARLNELRRERGWTQQLLAGRSNLPRSYIADMEGARRNPSLRSLLRVANALGVPVHVLLSGPGEPQ